MKKISTSIILLFIIVIVVIIFMRTGKWGSASTKEFVSSSSTPSLNVTGNFSKTGNLKGSTTPSDDEILSALSAALAKKYNRSPSSYVLSVTEKNARYAKGSVRIKGEMGGAIWFAAFSDERWVLASDGQGPMDCSIAEKYAFPTSMVPGCINSRNGNKFIQR